MPLSGVKVVDLTRILAGPFCTQLLGDLGADVIKIETPGGDPVRGQGARPQGFSWYFAQFNRNKRSVVLDLYSETGKRALSDLLRVADVLVENFRPGVLDKMGFGPSVLEEINPGLIVASVNGYGSTGPYVDRPSFDFIAQAMSGFMSVNGEPDGPPMRAAAPISDLVAGLYTALGVVSALRARDHVTEGRGQRLESSLTNGLISLSAFLSADYLATGKLTPKNGNDHPIVAPYGLFEASDGAIAVAPSNDVFVARFLAALGLDHLLEEPRFATNEARMMHKDALKDCINAVTRVHHVEHWIEHINAAGCPCGRVMGIDEVFADPQVQAQQMVIEAEHAHGETVRMTGFPIKLDSTPCELRLPAPALGADTETVLRELGYDEATIAEIVASRG